MTPIPHGNYSGRRLVVFGCGYVGTEIVRRALARNLSVVALTRNRARAEALKQLGAQPIVADLADENWHEQLPDSPDFVLNTVSAAQPDVEGYRHSYLEGMRSIARWARKRGRVGTLVYTSSTSVYPQGGAVRVDELANTQGGSERSEILRAAEREAADVPCRRWFVLRLAGIYGPARQHLIAQLRTGEVSGRADNHLNLAHRDDIAAAIWACFVAPETVRNEIFNVADDSPATKGEVVQWLADRLGLRAPRFTGLPAGGRRAVTPDRTISNEKLRQTLGWRPQFPSFREGYGALLDDR